MKPPSQIHLLSLLVLIVVGITIYSNSLYGEFISDDYRYIVDAPAVQHIGNLRNIWYAYNTRFIVGLTYALNYGLGQWNVFGYHLFNLISHLIASILVYFFVVLTFATPVMKKNRFYPQADQLAFFSALIFLCHPLQTQGVAYIMQRAVSMGAIVYLGTLIFFIKGRLESKPKFFIPALIIMISGFFIKEMTITLPVALCMYEFFFFESWRENTWPRIRKLIPFFMALGIFPLILLQNRADSVSQIKFAATLNRFEWNYLFTEINVLRTYLRLLFLPIQQNFLYDYPIAKGFWVFPTWASFVLLVLIFLLGIYWYSRHRLLSFCIFWYFLTTSVEALGVTFGDRDVIYEHWLYIAMVGFALCLTTAIYMVCKNTGHARWALGVVILLYCLLTYQRNAVWQTETGLWEDVMKKSPKKILGYWLGLEAYQRKGLHKEAYDCYLKMRNVVDEKTEQFRNLGPRQGSSYSNVFNNWGGICFTNKRYAEAEDWWRKSIELNPHNASAYNNLGRLWMQMNRSEEAIQAFLKSIELQGNYPDGYFYLGLCYIMTDQKPTARENFAKASRFFEDQRQYQKAREVERIAELFLK